MASRYTVAPGHEFNYPNAVDHKMILAAGGRSKMSQEALSRIRFKTVKEGDDCSDMPKEVFDLYLSRGWILDSQADTVEGEDAALKTLEDEGVV